MLESFAAPVSTIGEAPRENNKVLSAYTWKQTRSDDWFGNFAVAALDFLLYECVNEVESEIQFDDASSLSPVNLCGGGDQRITVNLVVTTHTHTHTHTPSTRQCTCTITVNMQEEIVQGCVMSAATTADWRWNFRKVERFLMQVHNQQFHRCWWRFFVCGQDADIQENVGWHELVKCVQNMQLKQGCTKWNYYLAEYE